MADVTSQYADPAAGGSHKSFRWADVIQGIMLATILSVYTFTAGTDIDEDETSSQYIKLFLIVIILFSGACKLAVSQRGLEGVKHVTFETKYIWIFMLICGLFIPFSYFPDVSFKKFAITAVGLIALQTNLAYYASKSHYTWEEAIERKLLAKHILFFICGLSVFGLFSLIFVRDGMDPREYPTAGLIHPNLMASALGLGFLHAAMYKGAYGPFPINRLSKIAGAVIFIAGLPVFFVLASRGATIALLISGLVSVLLLRARRNIVLASIVVLALASVVWFLDSQDLLVGLERNENETLSTLTGRTEIWDAVFSNMHGYNISTGFGYAIAFPSLHLPLNYGFVSGTHNAYLQALTSGGVLGFLAFTAYMAGNLFRSAIGSLISSSHTYFFACCIFLTVDSLSESLFGTNLTIAFALFICVQICNTLPTRKPAEESPALADREFGSLAPS